MIRHLVNIILFFLPPTRLFALRRVLLRWASVNLGEGVSLCGMGWIYGRGPLKIGEGTWISPRAIFYTNELAAIILGAKCDIGPDVKFVTGSHEIGPSQRRAGKGKALPIEIEDGCWVGAGATILGGVKLGAGSIVAAGSVVIADVEPDTLVAGVPAILKRKLS